MTAATISTDRYPCKGASYATEYDAAVAREIANPVEFSTIWRCLGGHFHQGVTT